MRNFSFLEKMYFYGAVNFIFKCCWRVEKQVTEKNYVQSLNLFFKAFYFYCNKVKIQHSGLPLVAVLLQEEDQEDQEELV